LFDVGMKPGLSQAGTSAEDARG